MMVHLLDSLQALMKVNMSLCHCAFVPLKSWMISSLMDLRDEDVSIGCASVPFKNVYEKYSIQSCNLPRPVLDVNLDFRDTYPFDLELFFSE